MVFSLLIYNLLQLPCEYSTIFGNKLLFRLFFVKNKLTVEKTKDERRKTKDERRKELGVRWDK